MLIAPKIPLNTQQSGIVLIEALVSILIFSVGVLAIIGLLTASVISLRDSNNRSAAGSVANQIIGQMWADDHSQLQAKYNSPAGVQYSNWIASSAVQALPAAATYPPTVFVSASGVATVKIYWKPPNAPTTACVIPTDPAANTPASQPCHTYIAVAQIN